MSARSVAGSVNRQVGDIVAGKYKLERQLGEGGMGIVFAALHLGTGRRVALKCMAPAANAITATARFKREAQAAGRIDHPNVVQVFDVGEDNGGRFIVMEFLKGEALGDVLHQRRLAPADAIDLLMPALRGVHAAHRQGVVHRDLKPDNIFVCRADDGSVHVKVLDFGVSKMMHDAEVGEDLTRTGVLLGTPQYMPPERVRGKGDADKRSDVYALGVILYEALSGHRPFDSEHIPELVARISRDQVLPLRELDPSIPEALDLVVLKALARDPDARYQDVESFAVALEPYAGEERFTVRRRDPTQGLALDPAGTPSVRVIPATETRRIGHGAFDDRKLLLLSGSVAAALLLAALAWALRTDAPAPSVLMTQPAPAAEALTGRLIPAATATAAEAPASQGETARPTEPNAPPPVAPPDPPRRAPRASGNARARSAPTPTHSNAREAPKPRMARGVRTGGLSEQDF